MFCKRNQLKFFLKWQSWWCLCILIQFWVNEDINFVTVSEVTLENLWKVYCVYDEIMEFIFFWKYETFWLEKSKVKKEIQYLFLNFKNVFEISVHLAEWIHCQVFLPFLQRETSLAISCFILGWLNSSKRGYTIKGIEFHLEKIIPKSIPHFFSLKCIRACSQIVILLNIELSYWNWCMFCC